MSFHFTVGARKHFLMPVSLNELQICSEALSLVEIISSCLLY